MAAAPAGAAAQKRRLRLSRTGAVSLYGLTLAVAAGILFATQLRGEPALSEPHLPWWAIALGWVIFESCVVHLQFRRSAHSFSLADVPFVFGLLFATADAFLLGAVLGSSIAYALRRLPLIKCAFNVA